MRCLILVRTLWTWPGLFHTEPFRPAGASNSGLCIIHGVRADQGGPAGGRAAASVAAETFRRKPRKQSADLDFSAPERIQSSFLFLQAAAPSCRYNLVDPSAGAAGAVVRSGSAARPSHRRSPRMASLSRDANGGARIQFVGADNRRRAIRLGKVTDRDAERVKEKVEQLNAAARAGIDPPARLVEWLQDVGDDLHAKLVKAGLAPPRATACPTLGEFLESYKAGRA